MDSIQPYKGDAPPPSTGRPPTSASLHFINPAAQKTTSHYFKAVRHRFWMVLAIAVPFAIVSSIMVLRLPPVYVVKAEIEINPPQLDPTLSALLTHEIGRSDSAAQASYIPNREARLRSKELAQRVVSNDSIVPAVSQYADAALELFKSLSVLQVKKNGNSFIVTLEGGDPALTKRLLEILLEEFKKQAELEQGDKLRATQVYAEENLKNLKTALTALEEEISKAMKKTRTVGPGGRNILEDEYINLGTMMSQKQLQINQLHQQMMISQMFPKFELDGAAGGREARLAQLRADKRKYERGLDHMKRTMRNFNHDPAAEEWAKSLEAVLDEIEELSAFKPRETANPTDMFIEQYRNELDADKEQHDKLLAKLQEMMPDHQRVLTLLRDREDKAKQISGLEMRLLEFGIVQQQLVHSDCVRIPASVVEPTMPIKPNRPMLIGFGLFASIGLGVGLVCLLEYIDHSVKVPEHVTHGLTLPLLGVVPRIRRTALTHRGGHLWTPGTPDSIEADAYRNVRASLLGIGDKRGSIVTLLVTSAKAGEGKSTTALNLAATCARAGERTLLMDVDFRRPSLADVFIDPESTSTVHGLVDVLRGDMPWQRTVRHTEIPNLDFIPTGDTRDIPIEILGTLELRQLLIALAHHYDRVILDGPAVLGLADCRVLGRIVDASLLVVRSGSHHLMTLHRAKAMLEQSHVAIAGVVFNGLTDDMDNWSSYGYDPLPLGGGKPRSMASDAERLALATSDV
jgi:polysaccharide biosynthesis transport protein